MTHLGSGVAKNLNQVFLTIQVPLNDMVLLIPVV